jgi:hypothetical protein
VLKPYGGIAVDRPILIVRVPSTSIKHHSGVQRDHDSPGLVFTEFDLSDLGAFQK